VDALAGLDDPCFAGLGLADGLGVDPWPLPHASLGEAAGAVEVQLPVVLQHPPLAGPVEQLGYRPVDDAETWAAAVNSTEADPSESGKGPQGGSYAR
jgi:hypothetical protein